MKYLTDKNISFLLFVIGGILIGNGRQEIGTIVLFGSIYIRTI